MRDHHRHEHAQRQGICDWEFPERRLLQLFKGNHAPAINGHLPALRHCKIGNHADRRLPILLRVHGMRHEA
jgi:hypothetical protein